MTGANIELPITQRAIANHQPQTRYCRAMIERMAKPMTKGHKKPIIKNVKTTDARKPNSTPSQTRQEPRALGGSISGEHGVGIVKRGQLARQWSPRALELHAEIKRTFDPKGLLNPGKKVARVGSGP